jgi:hypothetical protein
MSLKGDTEDLEALEASVSVQVHINMHINNVNIVINQKRRRDHNLPSIKV